MSTSRLDTINLEEKTPPTTSQKNPKKGNATNTQSAKGEKNKVGRHMTNSGTNKQQSTQNKMAILSIDIILQMCLGFPIHEALATQRDKETMMKYCTNNFFHKNRNSHKEND